MLLKLSRVQDTGIKAHTINKKSNITASLVQLSSSIVLIKHTEYHLHWTTAYWTATVVCSSTPRLCLKNKSFSSPSFSSAAFSGDPSNAHAPWLSVFRSCPTTAPHTTTLSPYSAAAHVTLNILIVFVTYLLTTTRMKLYVASEAKAYNDDVKQLSFKNVPKTAENLSKSTDIWQ